MHTNETELLLAYIAQQRDGIIYATHGLTDEEACTRPTVSGLTLITLIQHVAHVEQRWIALAADGVWESDVDAYQAAFTPGDRSLGDVVAHYRAVAAATEMAMRELNDLDRVVQARHGDHPHGFDRRAVGDVLDEIDRREDLVRLGH